MVLDHSLTLWTSVAVVCFMVFTNYSSIVVSRGSYPDVGLRPVTQDLIDMINVIDGHIQTPTTHTHTHTQPVVRCATRGNQLTALSLTA